MNLFQFRLLDEIEQIEAVWDSPLLATIEDDDFIYDLHQIHSFYAEVKYRKAGRTFNKMKAFKKRDLLKPYLDKIKIDL